MGLSSEILSIFTSEAYLLGHQKLKTPNLGSKG